MTPAQERCSAAVNRLCKWRTILVGRILGTKPADDPPTIGFRDIFDRLLILRVENSALVQLCIRAHLFTTEEYLNQIAEEADRLSKAMEDVFPGCRATDLGMTLDPRVAAETMKGWPK